MYWAWPLLMIFIPTWIGNYVLPGEPAQRLWDPSEILLAWAPSILQLFAYSPGYCIGVGLVLGVLSLLVVPLFRAFLRSPAFCRFLHGRPDVARAD